MFAQINDLSLPKTPFGGLQHNGTLLHYDLLSFAASVPSFLNVAVQWHSRWIAFWRGTRRKSIRSGRGGFVVVVQSTDLR